MHRAKSHKQYTHHHFFNQTSACIKKTAVEFGSLVVFSTTLFTRSHIQLSFIWHHARTRARTLTHTRTHAHTHTHTHRHTHPFNGPFSRTTWVGRYQKGKPIWILLKQETVSGSGISWATCKSTPRSRQITTPAPLHSVSYRPDALPVAQPTASKHWRHHAINIKKHLLLFWPIAKLFFIIVINNISHFQINIQICSAVQAIQIPKYRPV